MPTLASRMLLAAALVFSCLSATSGLSLSPITRVVELLNGISAKIEEEAKAEESLYETFVCWAKSITSQKTKSNTAASSRIQELTTYIADLDAGRVELTTERADLTKEMEEITADIESATAMRNKEQQDYEDAKEEMEQAIEALTAAVSVLKEATEGHKTGSLLAVESGFEARKKETESLNRAISMSERVLTKADAGFLRRLLTGEVPTWDWKKLNRKATFKMDYKARSFKIQEVLAKLLENFASDLKEATAKEEQAVALYDKLMESKGAEKAATSAALAKMEKETGARGMSRAESVEEVDTLTTQVENDKTYIDEVTTALEQKKTEWKERQALRTGELAAISKAIEILHSDDARDLFKKSFASQAKSVSLLQVSSSTSTRANEALMVLKGMTSQGHRGHRQDVGRAQQGHGHGLDQEGSLRIRPCHGHARGLSALPIHGRPHRCRRLGDHEDRRAHCGDRRQDGGRRQLERRVEVSHGAPRGGAHRVGGHRQGRQGRPRAREPGQGRARAVLHRQQHGLRAEAPGSLHQRRRGGASAPSFHLGNPLRREAGGAAGRHEPPRHHRRRHREGHREVPGRGTSGRGPLPADEGRHPRLRRGPRSLHRVPLGPAGRDRGGQGGCHH
mmetsp:Transcript_17483/g.37412  ORF Transcript_17483/g.37412 Transcript_17483/m.37412 type:complete len:623 (+) Transcript_17483:171-2039(+)